MFQCWKKEIGGRNGNSRATAIEVTMCHDKFRREPVTAEIAGSLGMIHSNGKILVHFKMKVGRIHPVVVADGADLLTSGDPLSFTNENIVEMR